MAAPDEPTLATRMAGFSIGRLDVFDDNSESWSCYKERLDQYFMANDMDEIPDPKKVAALLSLIGPRVYQIIRDLTSPALPSTKTFDELCELLKGHFNPKPLVIAERFRFHKRDQKPDESVRDFNISLRKLSEHCNFGPVLNDALRDRFVCGLKTETIQRKLLTEKALTYEKAIEFAEAMEAAQKDVCELQGKQSVNKLSFRNNVKKPKQQERKHVQKTKSEFKTKACFRCNRTNHSADSCKFKDSKCYSCGKKGHISPACLSTKRNRVHQLSDSDSECLFNIESSTNRDVIWVSPIVNGKKLNMELDTGSGVSVISKAQFDSLWPETRLSSTNLRLKTYSGEVLRPFGMANCTVELNGQSKQLKLYVVATGGKPLFGREWLRDLKLNWSEIKVLKVQGPVTRLDELKTKYADVFKKELGKVKGVKARLKLMKDANPKFVKARTVPFALKPKIEKELDQLLADGVLEKVDHSEWATPIVPVPKANGDIRICGDFKVTVNPLLDVDQYPLPRIEEIFMSLGNGQRFSKVDLKSAYLQIEMDEESKKLLTISTHKGLFRYNRLVFGIASAPAIFQRLIEQIVGDIPGVKVISDDMIITGKSDNDHLNNLESVLQKLQEYGLRVNPGKCAFFEEKIGFCGHEIDKDGLHKTEEKIKAVVEAPEIKNVKQLRSFLGLVQYYAKFMPNLSAVLHPLHALLHKDSKWIWTEACENAVKEVKRMITSDMVLMNYDPNLPLVLACDASAFGLGAVLSHVTKSGTERPIAFSSRSLTKAEQNYSQIDKEALALVWGVKKFNTYLYGQKFTLLTDHKPLLSILSPSKGINSTTAARLQRYALFLAGFTYDIKYKNTKAHGNCDGLSRMPLEVSETEATNMDYTDVYYSEVINKLPVTCSQLANATRRDKVLSQVFDLVFHGWTEKPEDTSELDMFWKKRHELSVHQGCVVWGLRVVVPESLQKKILAELHEGHLGVVKMKSLSRSYVWWPNIDKDIELLSKSCVGCMDNKSLPTEAPIHPWEFPNKPWSRIHVDFAGPFMGYMFLVIVDAYSKWPVVKVMKRTTASNTVEVLRAVFADCGVCDELVSDNGPQFVSEELANFLKNNGVKHIRSAPYHPKTNGLAERFVQTLKQGLKAAKNDSGTVQTKLSKLLLQYRNTQHATTKETPAMLFLGRALGTRLDKLKPNLRHTVEKQQAKMVRTTRDRSFEEGQTVCVRDYRTDHEKWIPGKISRVTGPVSYRVEVSPGVLWRRHADQMRSSELAQQTENVTLPNTLSSDSKAETGKETSVCEASKEIALKTQPITMPHSETVVAERRYPTRERKKPDKLNL